MACAYWLNSPRRQNRAETQGQMEQLERNPHESIYNTPLEGREGVVKCVDGEQHSVNVCVSRPETHCLRSSGSLSSYIHVDLSFSHSFLVSLAPSLTCRSSATLETLQGHPFIFPPSLPLSLSPLQAVTLCLPCSQSGVKCSSAHLDGWRCN